MVIQRGEIWWADLGVPIGSAPGYRRPVVVVQASWACATQIRTAMAAIVTTNLALAEAPGNVILEPGESGLPRTSVVNVSQVVTVDHSQLEHRVGRIGRAHMLQIDEGLRLLLDL